jgi:Putative amidoligase enzyme
VSQLDRTVAQQFSRGNWDTKPGEVGIEIEVEGRNLPGVARNEATGGLLASMQYHWRVTADGSLRTNTPGDQAAEYVLREPVVRSDLKKVLDYFATKFTKAGAVAFDSYRTSVHVHVNAQQLPIRHLYSWLTTYFILEETLVNFAGPDRVGNIFCLRAKDSDAIIQLLVSACAKGEFYTGAFRANAYKYGAVNLAALHSYGSLEFRALRGTVDTKLINLWIDMLLKIKDFGVKFDDPRDIIMRFSADGPNKFINDVLGYDLARLLITPNLSDEMFSGMRLAQDVAYAYQWQPFKKPEVEKVPEYNDVPMYVLDTAQTTFPQIRRTTITPTLRQAGDWVWNNNGLDTTAVFNN